MSLFPSPRADVAQAVRALEDAVAAVASRLAAAERGMTALIEERDALLRQRDMISRENAVFRDVLERADRERQRLHGLIVQGRALVDPTLHPRWDALVVAEANGCDVAADELRARAEKAEREVERLTVELQDERAARQALVGPLVSWAQETDDPAVETDPPGGIDHDRAMATLIRHARKAEQLRAADAYARAALAVEEHGRSCDDCLDEGMPGCDRAWPLVEAQLRAETAYCAALSTAREEP